MQAQLQTQFPSDAQLVAGAKLELHGYITLADAALANLSQITDYSLRQIGADGLPGGSLQSHVVRSGDTLQSIAQVYLGSSAYWYLVADANGLSGNEALVEGTTLTLPNKVANAANTSETYKVYNESEIIGSTSPEIRTIKKKKKWYQKLIQILIVVIMIVAAVITAGAALGAMGLIGPGAAGLLGVGAGIAGSVATALGVTLAGASFAVGVGIAALSGALIYAGASILTQGLAVAADLQDSFSWKAVGKAALQGAVSGAAGAIGGGIAKDLATGWQVAARVSVEAGKQLILDGKISNVAGLVGAAAAGGAFKGLGAFGKFAGEYSRVFSAGLNLLENKLRGRGDNAMSWVGLATAAIFDAGAKSGELRTELTTDTGEINWKYVAVQAVGAMIVGDRRGEDAGLSYLGNAIGSGISDREYRNKALWEQEQAQQAQQRQALAAMAAEDDGWAEQNRLYNEKNRKPGQSFADNVAANKAANNPLGLPTRSSAAPGAGGEPMGPPAPDQSDAETARLARQNAGEPTQERVRATSATVQKGDRGVETVAKRLAAANGEPDNWRAYQAMMLSNLKAEGDLRLDKKGNPSINLGQTLSVGDTTGMSSQQLGALNRAGGAFTAANTAQTQAYNDEQARIAAQAQQPAAPAATNGPLPAGWNMRDAHTASLAAQAPQVPRTAAEAAALMEHMANTESSVSRVLRQAAVERATAQPSTLEAAVASVQLAAKGAVNAGVSVLAGTVGIVATVIDGADSGANTVRKITDSLSLAPNSEAERRVAQSMHNVLGRHIEAGKAYLGDNAFEASGSPLMATGAYMAPELVAAVFGLSTVSRTAAGLRNVGVPDWRVSLDAPSPGTLYSNPIPGVSLERVGVDEVATFANRFPEDAVDLRSVPTLTPETALRIPKNILYVVKEDGGLVIAPKPKDFSYGHVDLARGENVLAAGEGKVLWGEVKFIDNASGHYLPEGAGAQSAAVKAFADNGFKVPSGAYQEKVYDFNLGRWVKK